MSDHVRIFDTTLRDGEQSPGATMTRADKVAIARQLDRMGVDVIEAGFPIASAGEADAVREIASVVKQAEVAALCRTREGDIRAAWEAVSGAAHPRLHVFIATSDLHLEHKLRMTREEVLEQVRFGVGLCASLCPSVEFSAEDATRSDLDFLREVMAAAVEAGATVLNVPDTVGYTMPDEYAARIRAVVEVAGERAIVSTHCHDDLGLACANSLAAVAAGARQIECCVNGIGERAGNAAMEEVVMALRTRRDVMRVTSRVDTRLLAQTSRMVADASGMLVPPNKAIVGRNAFAHESGIHQHGVLSERSTYEIMAPEDVGITTNAIVLGKHSGRHALKHRLAELGYELEGDELKACFEGFKALADKKKQVFDEDLHALVGHARHRNRRVRLVSVRYRGGDAGEQGAEAVVWVDGEERTVVGRGDGPVDASFDAIVRAVQAPDARLVHYDLSAVTEGSDALGRAWVDVDWHGVVRRGQGTHTDVVVASARAFADALDAHLSAVEDQPAMRVAK